MMYLQYKFVEKKEGKVSWYTKLVSTSPILKTESIFSPGYKLPEDFLVFKGTGTSVKC